jgi:hypothetical protein
MHRTSGSLADRRSALARAVNLRTSTMAGEQYELDDWEHDFSFLSRYVCPSESGYIPPDYLREIEAYFQRYHPHASAFRYERASSMLRFTVANIPSFAVGGLARITEQEVAISRALWFALWIFFGAPDAENFNPNPDPLKILATAEEAVEDEKFPRWDDTEDG